MFIFNLIFYSLYTFAKRTGHKYDKEGFAWLSLSGLVSINVLFLLIWVSFLWLPHINFASKNNSIPTPFIVGTIFYLYYIRRDKYKEIVTKYDQKSERERKMIFAFGIAYVVLSFAFVFFTIFFAH
jgi:hypothetical protein